MESILNLLGLARKAGRVVCGEEAVSEATEGKKIRLLLYAGDAAANSCRRALTFAVKGSCLALQLPCGKADMGRAVGYAECAMLGVTDIGFAGAIGKKLSQMDPAKYGGASERLEIKAKRAAERKREQAKRDKEQKVSAKPVKVVEKEELPAPKAPKQEKKEYKRPVKSGVPRKNARPSGKKSSADRFAGSRPVKLGKGSKKK